MIIPLMTALDESRQNSAHDKTSCPQTLSRVCDSSQQLVVEKPVLSSQVRICAEHGVAVASVSLGRSTTPERPRMPVNDPSRTFGPMTCRFKQAPFVLEMQVFQRGDQGDPRPTDVTVPNPLDDGSNPIAQAMSAQQVTNESPAVLGNQRARGIHDDGILRVDLYRHGQRFEQVLCRHALRQAGMARNQKGLRPVHERTHARSGACPSFSLLAVAARLPV